MLGMSLLSFLVLTLIGAVVAAVYHYVIRYRILDSHDAAVGKLIVGWLGAWLGSPILGHWLWKVENVYIVPAVLGAIAAIHLVVLTGKASGKLASLRPVLAEEKKEQMPVGSAAAA
jgi:uncharacterized membrane protein YeaQ/YmgE (transglycosylase-associated protein family)